MIEHEHVHVAGDGDVTTVTLDRPGTKNACTGDMWLALGDIFRRVSTSGARVVVLTGAGGDFCAGAELSGGSLRGGSLPGNQVVAMRALGESVAAIYHCPVPVIAKVDGVCVGGGLGVALAADLIWCSDRARFAAIFAKRGLSLDFGTSWLLRQRIGVHRAKQFAFTAEMMTAQRAYEYGFINEVVPVGTLDAAVDEIAASIASGPPLALSMIKRQLDNSGSASLLQSLEVEALAQNVNFKTRDMREALAAYEERRTPRFEGR